MISKVKHLLSFGHIIDIMKYWIYLTKVLFAYLQFKHRKFVFEWGKPSLLLEKQNKSGPKPEKNEQWCQPVVKLKSMKVLNWNTLNDAILEENCGKPLFRLNTVPFFNKQYNINKYFLFRKHEKVKVLMYSTKNSL